MMKQLIEHVHIHVNQHVRVMGFHVFFLSWNSTLY